MNIKFSKIAEVDISVYRSSNPFMFIINKHTDQNHIRGILLDKNEFKFKSLLNIANKIKDDLECIIDL